MHTATPFAPTLREPPEIRVCINLKRGIYLARQMCARARARARTYVEEDVRGTNDVTYGALGIVACRNASPRGTNERATEMSYRAFVR